MQESVRRGETHPKIQWKIKVWRDQTSHKWKAKWISLDMISSFFLFLTFTSRRRYLESNEFYFILPSARLTSRTNFSLKESRYYQDWCVFLFLTIIERIYSTVTACMWTASVHVPHFQTFFCFSDHHLHLDVLYGSEGCWIHPEQFTSSSHSLNQQFQVLNWSLRCVFVFVLWDDDAD